MNFPSDHYWHHGEYDFEWIYFYGKLDNGKYYHFAEFLTRMGGLYSDFVHYSIDGKFEEEVESWKEIKISNSGYAFGKFSFTTPEFGMVYRPNKEIIVHKTQQGKNYYSIPTLLGTGHLRGDKVTGYGWLDHEFSFFKREANWDWVGVRLNCGINIMAAVMDKESLCDVSFGDRVIQSEFILEGKHLFIHSLGMYLILEPVQDEVVNKPRLGVKYSEQPFNVISKGGIIGEGMRERSYMEVN